MSDAIIDLTASDNEVEEVNRPISRASNSSKSRRRGRAAGRKRAPQNATDTEVTEIVQRNNGLSSASGLQGDKSQSEQPKSNSLLSRLGMVANENKKENTQSKRNSRDRPPGEKRKDHRESAGDSRVQTESQTGAVGTHHRWSRSPSPNRPKEIPLSELPVEQLFFVDTGPPGEVGGEQAQPSPLGTGSTTPGTPETGAIPNAKAIKKNLEKERKKEREALAEGKVPGDTPSGTSNEVEFIGGSALVVEDQTVTSDTVTSAAGMITVLSPSVTESIQAKVVKPTSDGGTKPNGLSLPEHVTLWVEGDDDPFLKDATAALEIEEGIEYLDYEEDQATGVPRYFAPESATFSKKACRTCGEEGHIARNCKRLICLTCGERDDHITRNCPMRVVCFNCGGKGHLLSTCPQPRGQVGCDRCGSSKHIPQRCPEQFKTYVYLSEEERLQLLKKREALKDLAFGDGGEGYIARHIWCYNCGNSGHRGDDCKDPQPFSKPTEPCAFDSFNVSRGPFGGLDNTHGRSRDTPRPAWMDDDPHLQDVGRRGKEANMKRSRAAEASRIARDHDDDDWFSRTAGSSRGHRPANDRAKDNLPSRPKFSFQPRDDGGSSRALPGGHDNARERERDRRREKDRDKSRDNQRRKRGRDYDDDRQYHRRRDDEERQRRDYQDWRDEERRNRRPGNGGGDRRDKDRRGPQYRGSYA
ncbi:Zinc finger CCHC domain-containing protein 7 [Rhizoctonia solani]|uniref:Zinc finger CCHC domain-containing protein 7 n=1 Tax=Rhizoctonia solani TaxID=456999 RepID=A0A0K6FT04_9AGAM|nr:Zinc finger CCHC domain-containing protein 7 [Rhizoctonia solani]